MESDLLDQYERASAWTADIVRNASGKLGASTPCEQWDVRTLLNHMLETQQYFAGAAQGKDVSPPGPTPPVLIGDDPATDFERARREVIETFRDPQVREQAGPSLGIAFADQLLHGWDLAKATGQAPLRALLRQV
jgi:uncharacterized protein (TIGR03086 family)